MMGCRISSAFLLDMSGGSRPLAKEGARLTMNVEFCKDNSGTSKKMPYFQKNKVGAWAPGPLPWIFLDPICCVFIQHGCVHALKCLEWP